MGDPIDWKRKLDDKQIRNFRQNYAQSEKSVMEGFLTVFELVCETLQDSPTQEIITELAQLKHVLINYNLITCWPDPLDYRIDFLIFTQVVLATLLPPNAPLPEVVTPASPSSSDKYIALMGNLIQKSIAWYEKKIEIKNIDYKDVSKFLDFLNYFKHFFPQSEPSEIFSAWARQMMFQFFNLVNWLICGLEQIDTFPLEFENLMEVKDKCFELARWALNNQINPSLFSLFSTQIQLLYNNAMRSEESMPYYFDQIVRTYIPRAQWQMDEFKEVEHIQLKVRTFIDGLDGDLMRLERWGHFRFQLFYLSSKHPDQPSYLQVFEETRSKLVQWSQAALMGRMLIEAKLRVEIVHRNSLSHSLHNFRDKKEKDSHRRREYLKQLFELDSELLMLDEKRSLIQENWLNVVQAFFSHHTWMMSANRCLFILEKSEVRSLQQDWLHATCFAQSETEGLFASEMEVRAAQDNLNFSNNSMKSKVYSVRETFTMTDFFIHTLFTDLNRKVKAYALETHPDKHTDIPEIARAVFEKVDGARQQADKYYGIWCRSQWHQKRQEDPEIDAEALPPVTEDGIPQILRIEPPKTRLDLRVLRLHREYLSILLPWKKLNKTCQVANFADDLDVGSGNPEAFYQAKVESYYLRKATLDAKRQIGIVDKEVEQLNEETKKYGDEALASELRTSVLNEKNAAINAKLQVLCFREVGKKLNAAFEVSARIQNPEDVKLRVSQIIQEIRVDFEDEITEMKLNEEIHRQLSDEKFAHVHPFLRPSCPSFTTSSSSFFTPSRVLPFMVNNWNFMSKK